MQLKSNLFLRKKYGVHALFVLLFSHDLFAKNLLILDEYIMLKR
ncbi:hypothetical protein CP10743SC13_0887 [Chlamydia psittaci 10_743_SC13]|nr:hypothetical protein CP10743SC13_0887 [Chlamydia psittaci 10_743_SC13]